MQSDFSITTGSADLTEVLPQRVIAATSDQAALTEGSSVILTIPNGVERGDLLLVGIAFKARADISLNYRYNLDGAKAGAKVATLDPVEGTPVLDVAGHDFTGISFIESDANSAAFGGAQVMTFFRRAVGDESGSDVEIFIGRHEIVPDFDPIAAVVGVGCLVIRGFHWVGADASIGEHLHDSYDSSPYTIPLPETSRIIMGVNMVSFLGEFSGIPAASGWTSWWSMDDDGLAFACFTKTMIGAPVSPAVISNCVLEETPWVSGCAVIEALSETLNPIVLALSPGYPRNTGIILTIGTDPGGERTAEPVPYTWPVPPLDETTPPPLVPYSSDDDPEFRPGDE